MTRKYLTLAASVSVLVAGAGLAVCTTHADGAVAIGRVLELVGLSEPSRLPVEEKQTGEDIKMVRIVLPQAVYGQSTLTLSGRTAAAEEAQLASRASGIVSERRVDIGDQVKAGDILVAIDAPEVEQELRRARAAADQVRARLALAKLSLRRGESLIDKGNISEQTLDERRATKLAADADLAAAIAEAKRLEEVQSFQTIRAPFDGTIVSRNVDRGDKVIGDSSQNSRYLLRIARLNELRVEVDVPQSYSLLVKPGASAKVIFSEVTKAFRARFVRVSGQVDQTSGTMRAELLLPNPGNLIPSGMNGQVVIDVDETGGSVLVPTNTLMTRNGHQAVATVSNGRFQIRAVNVERDLGDKVVVSSGLQVDDQVVISPNALLQPGEEVQVIDSSPQALSVAE